MTVQPPLPGISKKRARPPRRSEAALQAQVIALIAQVGYRCLEIGKGRKAVRCSRCENVWVPKGGWNGNTEGSPDLFVYRDAWEPGRFLGLELKAEGTPIRPQQQTLIDAGRVVLIRSPREALLALLRVEETRDCGQAARLTEYLWRNEGRLD